LNLEKNPSFTLISQDEKYDSVCYAKVILIGFGLDWSEIQWEQSFEDESQGFEFARTSQNFVTETNDLPSGVYYIVIGNQPLGDCEISLTSVRGILKGIELFKKNPGSKLVLSGGKTSTSKMSEAFMMSLVAMSRGISKKSLILEDKSKILYQRAMKCAQDKLPLETTKS